MNLTRKILHSAAALLAAGAFTVSAQASIITDNPLLPSMAAGGGGPGPAIDIPSGLPSGYLSPAAVHAMYSGPGLTAILRNVIHQPFTLISRVPGPGGSQIEDFTSTLDAEVSINAGPFVPFHAQGPVQTQVLYGGGGPFGTFDTEMLSMSLTGLGPFTGVMIRESPTLASTGQTSVQNVPGGFQIDSFFDVFTELSVDGGATWMPNSEGSGSTFVELNPVPEPGTLLFGAALGLVAAFHRRRSCRG